MKKRKRVRIKVFEEFAAAENLLGKAGLLDVKLPVPLDAVIEYLSKEGLELRYYNPQEAPGPIKSIASSVDEVLVYQGKDALLFVNESKPLTRQRFSIFHGIGHFILPEHRGLNYLKRGCTPLQPTTQKPYERQADRFAAALNMPPSRFRHHMALLPFGMQTVEKLAERYSASIESAAIHYVTLAKAPCAMVWLERDYEEHGFRVPDPHLKVRYQVSNDSFPFRIKKGTDVPVESELLWRCSQEEYLTAGEIKPEHLGLETGTNLWIDCLPYDHIGTVMALVYLGNKEPSSVIDTSK
jgi:hypothetical protein